MWDLCAMLLDLSHQLVDVFFESHIEHGVGLIQYHGLECGEIQISSIHMVKDSSSRSNENINALSQLPGLLINRNSSIDG